MKKILIVSTAIDSPPIPGRAVVLSTLKSYLEGLDAGVDSVRLEDMEFTIVDGKPKVTIFEGVNVADYDIVYIKNWRAAETTATALAIYLKANGCRVICEELLHFRATDKISEAFLFACNGIPYPDTLFTIYPTNLPSAIEQNPEFTYPIVIKATNGSAGSDNYLVQDHNELVRVIENHSGLQFMAQNMIDNDGDHRILMMGFEPKLSFKRTRADDTTHLNNTSQGGSAILTNVNDYSKDILEDSIKAVKLVRREIAGVDILISRQTGKHVVLEVNASPQLATGAFLDEKRTMVHEYFEKELKELA